jgi:hypothetical protein
MSAFLDASEGLKPPQDDRAALVAAGDWRGLEVRGEASALEGGSVTFQREDSRGEKSTLSTRFGG